VFEAGLNADDVTPSDVGVTTEPAGFTVPTFTIDSQNRSGQWFATLRAGQRATEGNNLSRYLSTGLYRTDLMINPGGNVSNFLSGGKARRVYIEVSSTTADLNRRAEQEHCDDFLLAYRLTLGAVQIAIDRVAGTANGPHATLQAAVTAIRGAVTLGLHARISQVFQNSIDANGNVDAGRLQNELGALYVGLCKRSKTKRDDKGYHHFDIERRWESWSAWSWTEYVAACLLPDMIREPMLGEQKDIRSLVSGPSFNVPGPLSAAVIHL
jgi:hypothetical protein